MRLSAHNLIPAQCGRGTGRRCQPFFLHDGSSVSYGVSIPSTGQAFASSQPPIKRLSLYIDILDAIFTGPLKAGRFHTPRPLRHVSPPPPPPHESAVLEHFVTVMLEHLPQAPPSPMRHLRVLDPDFAVTSVRRQPAGTHNA